jgi:acetoin utilization protein AcuB
MIARDLITENITPLKTSDTGATAIAMMEEYRVSHLPIVNDLDFLGIISDTDISTMNKPDETIGNYKLSVIRASVTENNHIYEVMQLFSAQNLTLLPVVNEKNHYTGVITLISLVRHLVKMVSLENPGGIIVIEINEKDYVLTEIAGIVESNDAKILSVYITSFPDSTKLEVTIKVNKIDIGAILQTFNRYNYSVKASYSENTYLESMQERFDSLMNYLNI